MSYKLEKPYTDRERADFVVLYNHNQGLIIEETDTALYALDADEIMQNGVPIKNPNYAAEQLEAEKAKRLEENKEAYNAALKAGVTYKNALFDCDTLAAVRVMGQMAAMQAMAVSEEPTIDWFDYDYQPVTLTTEEFLELAGLITLNTRRIETLNCGFNTAISSAESLEELEAINISYSAEQESAEVSSSGENSATEDEIQD